MFIDTIYNKYSIIEITLEVYPKLVVFYKKKRKFNKQ